MVSATTDLTRSIEALAALLRSSQDHAMQAAEKLLKVGIQQAIQDSSVGTRVDLTA